MTPNNHNFSVSSRFARYGIAVFPCHAAGHNVKAPLVKRGFRAATIDPVQLQSWAHQFPNAAWAAPLPVGVVCVDIDNKDGKDGIESLIERIGPEAKVELFSEPPIIATPSGGKHLYRCIPLGLELINGTDINDMPGVDLRVGGKGYVMLPGTIIEAGIYRPENPYHGDLYCLDKIAFLIAGNALPMLEPTLQAVLQKTQQGPERGHTTTQDPVDYRKVANALKFLVDILPDSERGDYDSWRDGVLFPMSHGVRAWGWPEDEARRIYNEISALWGGDTAKNDAQWQAALSSDPANPITALSVLKKAHEHGWRWTFARMINAGVGI